MPYSPEGALLRCGLPASSTSREPMTAAPAGSSRTLPIIISLIGALILGYGLIILAPLVPTAAWSGILDSARVIPGNGLQFPGRKTPRAMTLYLRGAAGGRTFSLPAASTLTAESLKTGDTVHVSVGWATLREMAAVVSLTSGGAALVDSALVLRQERTQRGRSAALGGVILLIGLAGMMRSARKKG